MNNQVRVQSKTRVDTKVVVALLAAGVLVAAAIAGGLSIRRPNQQAPGITPGYTPPGYSPNQPSRWPWSVKQRTIKRADEAASEVLDLKR